MPPLSVYMVRAALLHMGIGFTLGALMLLDKAIQIDPDLWRLWSIHVELTLVGWIVQLAMGVAFWIMPRFARLPTVRAAHPSPGRLALLNAGYGRQRGAVVDGLDTLPSWTRRRAGAVGCSSFISGRVSNRPGALGARRPRQQEKRGNARDTTATTEIFLTRARSAKIALRVMHVVSDK